MFRKLVPLITLMFVIGAVLAIAPLATAGVESCDTRVNDNFTKLLECVTLEGVREHQAAFQAIATANGGIRAAGGPRATTPALSTSSIA